MSSGNVTQRGTNGRHQVLHRMGLSGQAACAHLQGETHGPLKFGEGLIISFLPSFMKAFLKCAYVHINQVLKSLEVLPNISPRN